MKLRKTKLPLWFLHDQGQAKLLRARAQPIDMAEVENPDFQQTIDDMVVTMRQAHGIGLAAPQIGKSIRLAVIDGSANDQSDPIVLINPSVKNVQSGQHTMEEGCLSVPKVYADIPRATELTLNAIDRRGKPYQLVARNFFARVIQHELDHLNGRLFIDRTDRINSGQVPT